MDFRYVNSRLLYHTLIGLILFDLVAMAAFIFPVVNWALLPVAVVAFVWILLKDIRWGILLPLIELAWGSFGSEIFWEVGSFRLSLRLVLFGTFLTVWFIQTYVMKKYDRFPVASSLGINFALLVFIVLWGIAVGFLRGNGLNNLFFDANAYLYILYVPLWLQALKRTPIQDVVTVVIATAAALSVKTLLLFHVFVNQYDAANIAFVYIWLRDTRIGEITQAGGSLWRIFIQSQIFIATVFMWYVVYIMTRLNLRYRSMLMIAASVLVAALMVSMSRSYWLGVAASLVIIATVAARYLIPRWRQFVRAVTSLIGTMVIAFGIMTVLVFLPYFGAQPLAQTLFNRLAETGDVAGISRLHLLPPLLSAVSVHPVIGQGFGATVTYQSSDPRIKNALNPSGTRTTFAFEWGYLDQLLKLGAIMLIVFGVILVYQFYRGWRIIKVGTRHAILIAGLLAGLLCVMIVHVVSPYLNHPLGLGYLMLIMVLLEAISSKKAYE